MGERILEAGVQKITGAAAGIVAALDPPTLAAGVRVPELRELTLTNVSGVAGEVGLGMSAAGTGAATSQTVADPNGDTGSTVVITNWATTNPSAPATFFRRQAVAAAEGAGFVWSWGPGELLLNPVVTNLLVLWQISAVAVTWDVNVKVAHN